MTQTNITQSTALLAQFQLWAELEPGRCNVNDGQLNIKVDGYWQRLIFHAEPYAFPLVSQAIVQAAVQEAIAVKGWDMTLHFTAGTDGEAIGYTGEVDTTLAHLFWQVFHAEPAIALLFAYLSALQATQTP